jgi:large subunit ribosomal protein L2
LVDFRQERFDMPAEVMAIEYDPNRGARIILIEYKDGVKAYWLAPQGVKVGDVLVSSKQRIEAKVGNRMPLEYVPIGLFVYNIELTPGKGGQIVRGAGNGAQLQVIEGDFAQLKLPSGEMRLVSKNCLASVGMVSNPDFRLVRLGKAGRKRKLGWRPAVEGKNMNPVDHPHGGGEGHSPIGLKGGPRTPWGKKALGVKTRKPGKWSNKFIVQRRVKKS